VLDSLNRLTDLKDLRWFPDFLPPHITLIISTLPGEVKKALLTKVSNAVSTKTSNKPNSTKKERWYGRSQESDLEYHDRNIANLAWIDFVFTLAHKQHLSGVIFFYQADMFYDPTQAISMASGYRDTIASLTLHSEEFNKPVLLINGDGHRLKIDQQLRRLNQPHVLENVLRLQVMGEDEVQAVEIAVDPASVQPFSFKPLILFENSLR
jgi:hypothetical protein